MDFFPSLTLNGNLFCNLGTWSIIYGGNGKAGPFAAGLSCILLPTDGISAWRRVTPAVGRWHPFQRGGAPASLQQEEHSAIPSSVLLLPQLQSPRRAVCRMRCRTPSIQCDSQFRDPPFFFSPLCVLHGLATSFVNKKHPRC